MKRHIFAIACVAALLATFQQSARADSEQQAFQAGVAASKRGDFNKAVTHFRDAINRGLDTGALYHNLGVAHYRLNELDKARQAFRKASQFEGMRALAYYNLGLVEQKAGNEAKARDRFRQAHEAAETRKLRRLAAARLDIPAAPAKPYSGYIEAFSGYDSNPRLAESDESLAEDRQEEGDAVLGAFGAGRYLLSGDWRNGVMLTGNAFFNFHPDLDDEDIGWLSLGGAINQRLGDWQSRYRLDVNRLRLGGDTIYTGARAGLRGRRAMTSNVDIDIRLRGEYLDGSEDDGFGYLTGWRSNLRARLLGQAGGLDWEAYYELEYNDRDDLSVNDDFFSVSPLRHEIGGSIEHRLVGRLTGEAGAAYRLSQYRDPEVRNGTEEDERDDDRLELSLGISHPVGADWFARLDATYWDNQSNFDQFEYERTEILVSIGRSFP